MNQLCITSKESNHESNNAVICPMVVSKLSDRMSLTQAKTKSRSQAEHAASVRGIWQRPRWASKMKPMAPPGHEGVGYVSKIGAGVTGVKEGDRVAGGGFATLRNLSAERLYKIPESEKPDQYWIVEPVSCAVTGVDHCQDPEAAIGLRSSAAGSWVY